MKVNFAKIDDYQNYQPLSEGKYLCCLDDITETTTSKGDEMWKLRFVVIDGSYRGRYIFDNMVFSNAAMSRVKLICSRLGLDTTTELEFEPDDLLQQECFISVLIEEYIDNEGTTKKRNVVPYAGYEKSIATEEKKKASDEITEDDIPF